MGGLDPAAPGREPGTALLAGDSPEVTDLLGALAYGELSAFDRLAADAALAPTLSDRAALSAMAVAEYGHFVALRAGLAARGADPDAAMTPFIDALDAFHDQTAPADWLQGLVKAYVGDGIAADFYREVAEFTVPDVRDLVLAVCADTGHAAFAVAHVREAIAAEPQLAGRLALWARRIVGEALTQAQKVVTQRSNLAAVLVGADPEEFGRIFGRVTDAQAARMQALGLSS